MEWALPAVVCFCVLGLGVSLFAVKYAIDAKIEVEALKRSTHNIQFVPVDPAAPDEDDAKATASMRRSEQDEFDRLGTIDGMAHMTPGAI